ATLSTKAGTADSGTSVPQIAKSSTMLLRAARAFLHSQPSPASSMVVVDRIPASSVTFWTAQYSPAVAPTTARLTVRLAQPSHLALVALTCRCAAAGSAKDT